MGERIKRVITSNIYFLVVISAVLINKYEYILSLMFLEGVIAIYEYFDVANLKKKKALPIIGYLIMLSYFLIGLFLKNTIFYSKPITYISFLILTIYTILKYDKINFEEFSTAFLGYIYIPFLIFFIPEIFKLQNGNILYLFLMFAVMGTDSGAYLVGIRIGKHKLTKVSPNKSIEGSIGGIVFALVINLLTYFALFKLNVSLVSNINLLKLLGITLIISIISQFGDLLASYIKRHFGKKDYGNILMGHGGILDRIDSLILSAPAAYMLFKYFLI